MICVSTTIAIISLMRMLLALDFRIKKWKQLQEISVMGLSLFFHYEDYTC